jgi:ribosomal protein S18 acetylase RimI-like enzyme
MSIRELRLPQDLEELAEMLPNSFQYPENPEWSVQEDERESLENAIESLRKTWWIIRIGQVFIPAMRDILTGFVWEENGKIAGCAILQPRGQSSQWVIGTIATHPEYRRRGIARQLFAASLKLFHQKQATVAVLGVIDGNVPAYTLYQKMGLQTYSGHYDVEFRASDVYFMPEIPEEFTLEKSSLFDWKPRYELSKRITPDHLQEYEPIETSRFRQPFFMRLVIPILNRADKTDEEYRLIRHTPSGQVVGYINLAMNLSGVGRHRFLMMLDPAYGRFAETFLQYALHRLTSANPALVIESGIPQWQGQIYEAAKDLGFTTRLVYHRMGIALY